MSQLSLASLALYIFSILCLFSFIIWTQVFKKSPKTHGFRSHSSNGSWKSYKRLARKKCFCFTLQNRLFRDIIQKKPSVACRSLAGQATCLLAKRFGRPTRPAETNHRVCWFSQSRGPFPFPRMTTRARNGAAAAIQRKTPQLVHRPAVRAWKNEQSQREMLKRRWKVFHQCHFSENLKAVLHIQCFRGAALTWHSTEFSRMEKIFLAWHQPHWMVWCYDSWIQKKVHLSPWPAFTSCALHDVRR